MKVGVPKEVKNHEYRVAITPAGVHELVRNGHEVFVQESAGVGSAIPDADFAAAGAAILPTADEVWEAGDLILKVKEPVAEEYHRMRKGQVLFTYLHLAASRECTDALLESGITAIAYETVQLPDGSLPLLAPMSEVAGPDGPAGRRASPAARRRRPGRADGRRLRRLRGQGRGARRRRVRHERGRDRARHAGRGAAGRQERGQAAPGGRDLPGPLQTVASNAYEIERAVIDADLVIGAVLVPGAKAPMLVSNDLVSRMKPGSVLVDISIDQGGCFEDSHPTTHADPTYQVHDSLFYCVANMPGAVPHTSTYALTNVTLPYVVEIANRGWRAALRADPALAAGPEHPRGHGHLPAGRRGARPAVDRAR